jgi:DNA adenine methylase
MTNISKTPFIKWTGSKRKQAPEIVNKFPKEINIYCECFLGGGSVLHEILNRIYNKEIKCNRIICCDINIDLITLWRMLADKSKRQKLLDFYNNLHYQLKERAGYIDGEITNEHVKKCQTLYYEKRDEYNRYIERKEYCDERAMLFYWITRTSFNGLIRYNGKTGKFNSPFHVGGRFGIKPEELKEVFNSWGTVIDNFIDNGGKLEFYCCDYGEVVGGLGVNDVVYMDPPYDKVSGTYFCQEFSVDRLNKIIESLTENGVKVLLSYDGLSGEEDRTSTKISNWYKSHEYINAGRSSFKGLKSKSRKVGSNDIVKDSLYINY